MLKSIEIENIKGINHKQFNLDMIPNKPSLVVAPNGFGKSSIAIGFDSMNRNRIDLQEEDYHKEDESKLPRIKLKLKKSDGNVIDLEATEEQNSISNEIGYFVINNRTKPKGIGSHYGTASARLEIENITLINTIPDNVSFDYSYRETKREFGQNGKVLPNLDNGVLNNLKFIKKLSKEYESLRRANNGKRVQQAIKQICNKVNNQSDTADEILRWIDSNQLEFLKQIKYVSKIGDLLSTYDLKYNFVCENYLAAIQLVWLYNSNDNRFRKACKYSNYLLEKNKYKTMLSNFNCTWKNIRASKSGGELIIKFPKAVHISNGERDILTFISMLFKAKQKLNKDSNILIIDEVFDYLDDANLTAAQYYITKFIDEFKEEKDIYPIILTHLNPDYFKNYTFSNQKVYYLKKFDIDVDHHFVNLLRRGDNPKIKADVSKHLLHFHPDEINKREDFRELALPELWGEEDNFYQFLYDETENYLNGENFCPFAVCGAVRVKIEHIVYNKLKNNDSRTKFLNTHGTRKKLKEAEELVVVPESYYLLGIIYNEGMHWKEHQDNISPIASKLENKVIQKLINDIMDYRIN